MIEHAFNTDDRSYPELEIAKLRDKSNSWRKSSRESIGYGSNAARIGGNQQSRMIPRHKELKSLHKVKDQESSDEVRVRAEKSLQIRGLLAVRSKRYITV